MDVEVAVPGDVDGFMSLAAEVEPFFGPMVRDPDFHAALESAIDHGTAFVVRSPAKRLLGGLLAGGTPPTYRLDWLVVSQVGLGRGVGRALVEHALASFTRPCRVEVITFGPDHPGVLAGSARDFYQRLGFQPGLAAPDGPEGGSRQYYFLEFGA